MVRNTSCAVAFILNLSVAHGYTDRPIIGVLSVPTEDACVTVSAGELANDGGGSCFHSLYVKWIEAAGGRVVPLLYDAPWSKLDQLHASVNGILFTGGETNVTDLDSRYMLAAGRLLNRTIEANQAGIHMPLWATCMGLQTLSVLVSKNPSVLHSNAFDSESLSLPLNLTIAENSTESRFLREMPPDVLKILTTENVTVNLHHDGVPPEEYTSNQRLEDFFRVVSTNVDRKGRTFVSTIEAHDLPVYAVQWHPERPQFQFSVSAEEYGINHSMHAIRAMQAVAVFFVNEARQNSQRFDTAEKEAANLIYNYSPVGPSGDSYQAYIFPSATRANSFSNHLLAI